MNWTFGIITNGAASHRVNYIIKSIHEEVPHAEIIIIGQHDHRIPQASLHLPVLQIPFDESKKDKWITRKKNLIIKYATRENICFLHDYVALEPGWAEGFEKFGNEWLTCMTKIINQNGERFRDWCVIYNNSWMNPPIDNQVPPENVAGRLLKYDSKPIGRWQYYSGACFCAKTDVMKTVPFDENRIWGQGEDVQWSRLVYQKYGNIVFNMNIHSTVKFLKQKEPAPWESLPPL